MIGLDDQNGYFETALVIGDTVNPTTMAPGPLEAAYIEAMRQQFMSDMANLIAVYQEGDVGLVVVSKINGEWVGATWDDNTITYETSDGITFMQSIEAFQDWSGLTGLPSWPSLMVQGF